MVGQYAKSKGLLAFFGIYGLRDVLQITVWEFKSLFIKSMILNLTPSTFNLSTDNLNNKHIMQILHLHWSLATGGTETMLVDIVNEQCKEHQVTIIVINDQIDAAVCQRISPRVSIRCMKRKVGSKSPWSLLKLNWVLWTLRPDVIHVHCHRLVRFIRTRVPLVRTIHSTLCSPEEYHRYKRLCSISESVKAYTASQGFPDSIIVYNGIHTDEVTPRIAPLTTEGIRQLICVGRLEKVKGQQLLVEAVRILVNERGVKNFHLTLIGDGSMRSAIEDALRVNGLTDFVTLLGTKPRSYFYPRLKDYDLFVMPSLSEGFGLTLAEACAAKIPVMTCDLEGPMEVIGNGRYGASFETGNAVSLADALQRFLSTAPDVGQVESAYQFTRENFDVRKTAEKYLRIYGEVVK